MKTSKQLDRDIDESLSRGSSKATRRKKPLSPEAVAFFRKNAGAAKRSGESWAAARTRGARRLAEAEAEATARGWSVDWEDDIDPDRSGIEDATEILTAVLRDEDGNVLASLGSIGMSGNRAQDKSFGRVIEAELALEALANE